MYYMTPNFDSVLEEQKDAFQKLNVLKVKTLTETKSVLSFYEISITYEKGHIDVALQKNVENIINRTCDKRRSLKENSNEKGTCLQVQKERVEISGSHNEER